MPFWWWYRLINHSDFRFDDYYIWSSFWSSLNGGWLDMNYKYQFEKFWGIGAKPEVIKVSQEDFNSLVKRLELPSEATMESVRRLMNRKAPWDEDT